MQPHRETLDRFRAWQRALPHVGAWVGATLSERDALVQAAYGGFNEQLHQARPGDLLDFSPVSGAMTGDRVRLLDGGHTERFFDLYPGNWGGPLPSSPLLSSRGSVEGGDQASLWAALMCFFHAHWLPSATNWQPMRVVVGPDDFLILRQNRYRSLLGDVLEAFSLPYETHEDRIDAGIFLEGVLRTAAVQGLDAQWRWAEAHDPHPLDPQRFVPFVRLRLTGEGAVPDWFERLSLSRVSQRVASKRSLDLQVLHDLWHQAMRVAGAPPGRLRLAGYGQGDPVPGLMGEAMHGALYGEAGFLSRMTLDRLCVRWGAGPDDSVARGWLGDVFWARLSEGGRYQEVEGRVFHAGGKPLLVKQAAKLLKGLAQTFGTHFLQFQNTHPLTGVLAVENEGGYVWLGRVVAVLLWLTRAQGYSAIVKSGPIILAGESIRQLTGLDAQPALIVQIGWPLGLDETVGDHSGLEERLRDKRPPKSDLLDHLVFSQESLPARLGG